MEGLEDLSLEGTAARYELESADASGDELAADLGKLGERTAR